MTQVGGIIGLAQWLESPPGRYLLAWEQAQTDRSVADVFGFHALQLGMTELDGLRANRMPHRWLALDAYGVDAPRPVVEGDPAAEVPADRVAVVLRCDFDALPFDSQSLDLVVLPHTLELARDPHLALGEVERVLRPEGRIVILGFNPTSLWGLRQRLGRLLRYIGFSRNKPLFLPSAGEFLGYWRLRDWLRLLSFEVQGGRFGCYRPPLKTDAWLARYGWIERIGERWWPVLGSVYLLVAVKRVRGMRLVGLIRQQRTAGQRAATVASHRAHQQAQQGAHSSSETP
ncbi:methyltransferase domain-containing protein [Rhizobacter sp. SG703]|uniref:class I SAM-dependent methyltransferase n=1 Tax=Rhizobacter sp. SG703 TaxID=2587140 RepID=UPI0014476D5D|nr:methyltransferase domain-containing protein [Rhizobacter sp. SG703]NKI96108.1 SAM-dependent methyltransferase [Rhizobacter sp. SG703]